MFSLLVDLFFFVGSLWKVIKSTTRIYIYILINEKFGEGFVLNKKWFTRQIFLSKLLGKAGQSVSFGLKHTKLNKFYDETIVPPSK